MGLEDTLDTTMWPFSNQKEGISQAGEYLEERTSNEPQDFSRRKFLKTTGLTLGAAALATSIPKPAYAAIQKLTDENPVDNIPQVLLKTPYKNFWILHQSGINDENRSYINRAIEQYDRFVKKKDREKTFLPYIIEAKFGIGFHNHLEKSNPLLHQLVSGYHSFLDRNFSTANTELANALFLGAEKLGYKPKNPLINANEFLGKSPSQMKEELNEIAKYVPETIHFEAIYNPNHHKEESGEHCNDAFLTYMAAGILAMNFALQEKYPKAQIIVNSELYKKGKKKLDFQSYDKKLNLS